MTVEPVEWKDLPDQSTPLSAATLNAMQAYIKAQVDLAVAAKSTAVQAALDATAPTDTTVANLVDTDGTLTKGALDTYVTGEVIPAAVAEIGSGYVRRVGGGPVALSYAALPLPGSPRAGNVHVAQTAALLGDDGHNAFPGLALCGDGSLLAVWRVGTIHGIEKPSGLVSARSSDLGATWTDPAVMFADPDFDQRDAWLTRLASGVLILTYFKSADGAVQQSVMRTSSDYGQSWSAEADLTFGFTEWGAVNGVVETASGALIAFGYGKNVSDSGGSTRVMRSTDGGATWGSPVTIANGPSDSRDYTEVCVNTLPNGTLMALVRAESGAGIFRCASADDGATWTAPAFVVSGDGRPGWIALASGGVVATYRRLTGQRDQLVITSWDNGATWSSATELHPDATVTLSVYSQMVEVAPGLIGVIFSDEAATVGVSTRFKYLMDGVGITPLGDFHVPSSAAPTAWVPLTPAANWRAYSNDPAYMPAWRVNGDMVEVRPGMMQRTGADLSVTLGAAATMAAALPSDVWPATTAARSGGAVNLTSNAPTMAVFFVSTTGVPSFVSAGSGTLTQDAGNAHVSVPYLTWPVS